MNLKFLRQGLEAADNSAVAAADAAKRLLSELPDTLASLFKGRRDASPPLPSVRFLNYNVATDFSKSPPKSTIVPFGWDVTGKGFPTSISDIGLPGLAERVPAIAQLRAKVENGDLLSSSFHLGKGSFMTAFHAVGEPKTGTLYQNLRITLQDRTTVPVNLIAANQARDVAIVQGVGRKFDNLPALPFVRGETKPDTDVFAIGFSPLYDGLTISKGKLVQTGSRFPEFQAHTFAGMSGGPGVKVNGDRWEVAMLLRGGSPIEPQSYATQASFLRPLHHAVTENIDRRVNLHGAAHVARTLKFDNGILLHD